MSDKYHNGMCNRDVLDKNWQDFRSRMGLTKGYVYKGVFCGIPTTTSFFDHKWTWWNAEGEIVYIVSPYFSAPVILEPRLLEIFRPTMPLYNLSCLTLYSVFGSEKEFKEFVEFETALIKQKI